jgi:hypothetical protein
MEPEPQDFELLSPRIPQASSPSRDEERWSIYHSRAETPQAAGLLEQSASQKVSVEAT